MRGDPWPAERRGLSKAFDRQCLYATIAVCCGLAAALAIGELLLRALGRQPWTHPALDAKLPIMHEPDPVLGWKNKQGRYSVPGYTLDSEDLQFTFLDDGMRATSPHKIDGKEQVVTLGCSYTQGWAVSDHETYAWKIQERFHSVEILNYGTGGYSTYQTVLVLEKLF